VNFGSEPCVGKLELLRPLEKVMIPTILKAIDEERFYVNVWTLEIDQTYMKCIRNNNMLL
jgi:hypothetical protein